MKNKLFYVSPVSAIFALIVCLFLPVAQAQDPGFFLDDWQEKSAKLPEYQMTDKPGEAATVNIHMDVNQVKNRVPNYIYGNNAVTWDNGLPKNATAMTDLKNLDPHVLRWPGGSLSDNYFWNVPYGQRPDDIPSDISPWYGKNTQNWQMSTDEYYELLDRTSSTGIIVVNYGYARYGTGPNPVGTAAHMAAEWVRYDQGRSKFWEIGNENFGNWESGYQIDVSKNQDGQPAVISGRLYGQHCRVFIDSMRAAAVEIGVDIKIGVVAYDAEDSWDAMQTVWNEEMMPEVADLADFLSVHSYFTPYDQNSTVGTILDSHDVPEEIMSVMLSDMSEAGKPMIPVAMTEWNIFAVGSMQQVSYINGMLSALVLGEFIRNDYGLGARWDLVNGWNNGDDHAMFSTGGEPGVDPYNPRAAFFYMYYFQNYFGDQMIEASVTGNSSVIAYGSSFSSGETGMVIVNKSTKGETLNIEIENFEPGRRYYYHTLTGGNDNGDFSRKVFVNGYGTSEEGGGPDDYESIKAFASEVEGGISVALPPLSVVYLMVDRKELWYISSKIDTNARLINVELSEPFILADDPGGFEVRANGSNQLAIAGIEIDPENALHLFITLDQEVLVTDEITLSFSGSDIMSLDSIALAPFTGVLVENLLPGAPPVISDAFTTSDGTAIRLFFNMGMKLTGTPPDSFVLTAGGETERILEISEVHVDQQDSTIVVITPAESLFAEYDLVMSYSGNSVMSMDDGLLQAFDSFPVTNQAPGLPPEIVSAEVADAGFSIKVLFSKAMNDLSAYASLFTVTVNTEIFALDALSSTESSMHISLADYIRYDDGVTLSYEGTEVRSVDRGVLQTIENFPVQNTLVEPTIFEIPGVIDAELFSIKRGMALEACSDIGGGYNLTSVVAGDWAEYEVNVSEAGYYAGNLRVAAAMNTGRLIIQTPDGDVLNQDTVAIPASGGWQKWVSTPVEIFLNEGRQKLRFTALTSYFNINWLDLLFDRTLEANVQSAITNSTGDTIEVVFDRELATPENGEQASFTIMAGGAPIGVSHLSLKDEVRSTLLLVPASTLSPADDNITVSYEPGNLMAADHIAVPSFSDIPVTNNVITAVEALLVPEFSIYPNPVRDMLNVEIMASNMDAAFLQIVDILGQTVYLQEIKSLSGEPKIHLDMSHFQEGLYLVRIYNDKLVYQINIIKQR